MSMLLGMIVGASAMYYYLHPEEWEKLLEKLWGRRR